MERQRPAPVSAYLAAQSEAYASGHPVTATSLQAALPHLEHIAADELPESLRPAHEGLLKDARAVVRMHGKGLTVPAHRCAHVAFEIRAMAVRVRAEA